MTTVTITRPYLEFENAPPPPLWTESTASNVPEINAELLLTYKYPRLYLHDPACVINGQLFGNNNDQNGKKLWWFHLARRMYTTLEHVQDGNWRELQRSQGLRNNGVGNSVHCSDSSATASSCSEGGQQRPLCSTLEDGSRAMSELCLGKRQQHRATKHRSKRGGGEDPASTVGEEKAAAFQPESCPQNSWSEPSASTMNVRGRNYLNDEIKVASETSIFTVLGVDNFVSGGKGAEEDVSWATMSYLRRWNVACEEVGLVRPPFL